MTTATIINESNISNIETSVVGLRAMMVSPLSLRTFIRSIAQAGKKALLNGIL